MKLPKIDSDDLVLFGSLALLSVGAAFVTASSTGNGWLAFGIGLIVLGLPSALLGFLASEQPK